MNDVLWIYGTHNRIEYNKMTFPLVLKEARDSHRFGHLLIIDDNSTDGTREYIESYDLDKILGGNYTYLPSVVGNSYDQWNIAKDAAGEGISYILSMCNDQLFATGIVDELAGIMDMKNDCFGVGYLMTGDTQRGNGDVVTNWPYISRPREVVECTHIGSGMVSLEAMRIGGDVVGSTHKGEERFFGFTQYQNVQNTFYNRKTYTARHIRNVLLDRTEAYSLNDEHKAKGYTRTPVEGKPARPVQSCILADN